MGMLRNVTSNDSQQRHKEQQMKQTQEMNQGNMAAWLDPRKALNSSSSGNSSRIQPSPGYSLVCGLLFIQCGLYGNLYSQRWGSGGQDTVITAFHLVFNVKLLLNIIWNNTYQVLNGNKQASKAPRLGQAFKSPAPWLMSHNLFDLTSGWQPLQGFYSLYIHFSPSDPKMQP